MKSRISKVLNFFAFNLLFFALYLNFVHKDNNASPQPQDTNTASFKGTVLVENPEQYINKSAVHYSANQAPKTNQTTDAKLAYN
jgi:hypothetical protein